MQKKEQLVASFYQAAINTIYKKKKKKQCSYSQMLRDNLLLIKYSQVLRGILASWLWQVT